MGTLTQREGVTHQRINRGINRHDAHSGDVIGQRAVVAVSNIAIAIATFLHARAGLEALGHPSRALRIGRAPTSTLHVNQPLIRRDTNALTMPKHRSAAVEADALAVEASIDVVLIHGAANLFGRGVDVSVVVLIGAAGSSMI